MIKIIFGTDRYLVARYRNSFKGKVDMSDMNEATFDAFQDDAYDYSVSCPFLSDKKTCFVNVDSFSGIDTPLFGEILKKPPLTTDIIITVRNMTGRDKLTKLYKALKASKLLEERNKFKQLADVKKAAYGFAATFKASFESEDVVTELIRRVNYLGRDEVDLYGIRNAIKDCASLSNTIDMNTVTLCVKDNEKEQAFILTKLLAKGDVDGLRHQCRLLDIAGESPLRTLRLILKDFRVAYKCAVIGKEDLKALDVKIPPITRIRDRKVLLDCIKIITEAIDGQMLSRLEDSEVMMIVFERLLEASKAVVVH